MPTIRKNAAIQAADAYRNLITTGYHRSTATVARRNVVGDNAPEFIPMYLSALRIVRALCKILTNLKSIIIA
jgi:hypothetical protein